MYTNADCTIYQYSSTGYTRLPVHNVFWSDSKQSNILKSGMTNVDSVKLMIPVSSANNLKLILQKDIVIKGISDFEVDNTDAKTISEGLSYITNTLGGHSISTIADKRYGSPEMHHYDLSLK